MPWRRIIPALTYLEYCEIKFIGCNIDTGPKRCQMVARTDCKIKCGFGWWLTAKSFPPWSGCVPEATRGNVDGDVNSEIGWSVLVKSEIIGLVVRQSCLVVAEVEWIILRIVAKIAILVEQYFSKREQFMICTTAILLRPNSWLVVRDVRSVNTSLAVGSGM